MLDLSSLTKDRTCTLYNKGSASQPLDHQGIPYPFKKLYIINSDIFINTEIEPAGNIIT